MRHHGEAARFDRIEFIPTESTVAGRSSLGSTSSQVFTGLAQTEHSGLLGTEVGFSADAANTIS
ncbi:hypothetical protein IQ241_03355 [Romeria aff. gracilis LEGE 07310]|uniref:Uncharacterized protein n=1 Tax=Vasconcelosia minhoensis LEGE 07310 TaxID=915328 RepID=A0A8J7DKF4_9CYAN|nr:hypothetical protein [Romeria gracilis]MBE9076341.1 hypothetical protein [Romeria aff. gracilis LEGE 07310]